MKTVPQPQHLFKLCNGNRPHVVQPVGPRATLKTGVRLARGCTVPLIAPPTKRRDASAHARAVASALLLLLASAPQAGRASSASTAAAYALPLPSAAT